MTTITKEQALASLNEAADYLAESCGSPKTAAVLRDTLRRYIEQQSEADTRFRWIERWHGSGPDRGWWVWEADHGGSIAYCGEGEFAERLCSLIVEKHNAAMAKESAAAEIERAGKESGNG